MKNSLKQILVLSVLLLNGGLATAETLSVPEGGLSAATLGIEIPERGMTQQQVEDKFGAPISKSTPVDDPPIIYWTYDKYTVYFVGGKVLDTVRNQPKK